MDRVQNGLWSRALGRELAVAAGLVSLGLWWTGRKRGATATGLLGVGFTLTPMLSRRSFAGRSVVVTGGSRGLGLAIAEELVREGAFVTVLARDPEELSFARARLEVGHRTLDASDSGGVDAFVCDVTDPMQLEYAFRRARSRFGAIDTLINNAGAISVSPFAATVEEDFRAQLDIHFYAILRSCRAVVPFMHETGGRIVNVSSIGGVIPIPHMSAYCASKHALAGLSKTLSLELAERGVRVTTVFPGLMRTGSAIQAVFKGDAEREFAWFATGSVAPLVTVSARRAARQIVAAARDGRSTLVISAFAKLAGLAQAMMPELFHMVLRATNTLLPHGASTEHRTGAASRSWLDERKWSGFVRSAMDRAATKYNEREKFDAEFNLNAT